MSRSTQGRITKWSQGGGVGTIVGDDGRKYFLAASVLRKSKLLTYESGNGQRRGRGGEVLNTVSVVDEVALEKRMWCFEWQPSRRGPGFDPEITSIWRGASVEELSYKYVQRRAAEAEEAEQLRRAIATAKTRGACGDDGEEMWGRDGYRQRIRPPRGGRGRSRDRDDRQVAVTARVFERPPRSGENAVLPRREQHESGVGRENAQRRPSPKRGGRPSIVNERPSRGGAKAPPRPQEEEEPPLRAEKNRHQCMEQVIAYLLDQDLGKFTSVFRKEGCDDMEILRELEDEDLRDLGLGVGHIRRFRRGIPEPESNSTLL
jgi:hypothetical protein